MKRLGLCALATALAGNYAAVGERPQATPRWNTYSDTWVATDALGRSLPTSEQVGPPRANKFVAVFYFLWHGQHGNEGPFDISRIRSIDPTAINNPVSPLWGPPFALHHWGESWFNYYVSDDEAVLAKHAQMLSDAGVDVVVFDVTNQLTYPHSWQALCRVWDDIRRRGGTTPQIAFLCPFSEPQKVVHELYDTLYGPKLYPDLWFLWEGKPLILADQTLVGAPTIFNDQRNSPAALNEGHTLGQSFRIDEPFTSVGARLPTWKGTDSAATLSLFRDGPHGVQLDSKQLKRVRDNDWATIQFTRPLPAGNYYLEISHPMKRVGWWSGSADVDPRGEAFSDGVAVAGDRTLRIKVVDDKLDHLLNFFTFRSPQPDMFAGPRGPGDWGWLEVHPQHAFYKSPGVVEEVTVGVAQNAEADKLSVFTNPRSRGRSFHNGRQPDLADQDGTGRNFAEQWERALKLDPSLVFVTGWNEWVAGRYDPSTMPLYGTGPVTFVDTFSREYSRDIEPMKGGHGDNYYYQMIANIRRFKGARPSWPVRSQPIQIDGKFSDWKSVQPEFCDDIGDPMRRDHLGWGKVSRYVNQTGRNDIVAAKVSFDATTIYFYVRTREPLAPSAFPNWMLLFINADHHSTNGWLGYDFVVNRSGVESQRTVLERQQGKGYQWDMPVELEYRSVGNEMELSIPRSVLGIGTLPATIDFKWADNIQQTGDARDFTVNGDSAPNDRFNYRAVLNAESPTSDD